MSDLLDRIVESLPTIKRTPEVRLELHAFRLFVSIHLTPFQWRRWFFRPGRKNLLHGSSHWYFGPAHVWWKREDMTMLGVIL